MNGFSINSEVTVRNGHSSGSFLTTTCHKSLNVKMFSALSSVSNAKKWLRRVVDKKSTGTKHKPKQDLLNNPNCSNSFEDCQFKSHSAPEITQNIILHNRGRSHFANLKAICDQSLGGTFFSSDIGNDMSDRNDNEISDDETTDIDFYVNEYTRKKEESFDEYWQNTIRRSASAGPVFDTQLSTVSRDSGICMNDVKRGMRRNSSHMIRHESQNFSVVSSTSLQTNKNGIVQNNRKFSIVVSVEDETIKTTPNMEHTKPRGSIARRIFRCSKSKSVKLTSFKRQEKVHLHKKASSPFQRSNKRKGSTKKRKEECGKFKLSLQFFNDSQQLRVIAVRANKLHLHNCHVEAKISLIDDNAVTIKTTEPRRVKEGDVHIRNEVYFNTASDDLCDSRLKIQVYKVSTILRCKTLYGQTIMQLDELDLNLDTSMWVSLFKPNGEDAWTSIEIDDILICTEDRSIMAETAATLFTTDDFDCQLTPQLPRARSMTVNRRQSISQRRRFNTMPLMKRADH